MTTLKFYDRYARDGRAWLTKFRWLIRIRGQLILCTSRCEYPAIRFVNDDEPIKTAGLMDPTA